MPDTLTDVRDRVIQIICDELGWDLDDVTEQSHLVDDLGAHSLDVVEVMMIIEEEFGFEVPDAEADSLQTAGDFVSYVISHRQPVAPATRPVAMAASNKPRTPKHSEDLLSRAIQTKKFRQYYKDLELDEAEIVALISRIIGERSIDHVTTRVIEKGPLGKTVECVHLFLLGKQNLFYFKLRSKSVRFEWAALKDLRLTYEVSLDHNRKISMISVKGNAREGSIHEQSPRPRVLRELECQSEASLYNVAFEFEGKLEVKGALDFLHAYLANLEDEE